MHFFLEKSAQRYDFLNKYSSKTLLILGCAQIFFSTIYKKGVTGTRGNDSARTRNFFKERILSYYGYNGFRGRYNVQCSTQFTSQC